MSSSIALTYRNRPIRIAFLLDPNAQNSSQILRKIIEFNSQVWGGRYNPIIPIVNGRKVLLGYDKLLSCSDPDIIFSFTKLDKKLVLQLDKEISPICIQEFTNMADLKRMSIIHELNQTLVSSSPILDEIKEADYNYSRPYFVSIKTDETSKYYDFFLVNFGKGKIMSREALSQLPIVEIGKGERFSTSIDRLTEPRKLLFSAHNLTLYDTELPFEHQNHQDSIDIFIGSQSLDLILYWNNIFYTKEYKHKQISQLYIPKVLLDNKKNLPILRKLIETSLYSNANPTELIFSSVSLSKQKIKNYVDKFKNLLRVGTISKINKVKKEQKITQDLQQKHIRRKINAQYQNQYAIENIPIQIPPPNFVLGGEQSWMTDIFAEYRPEKFDYTNQKYYWMLPKQSGLTNAFATNYAGRILLSGEISLQLSERNNSVPLKIPKDSEIFRHLITYEGTKYYDSDIRTHSKKYYEDVDVSDKGALAYGTLKLFEGLWTFGHTIENKYWRTIIEGLSIDQNESEKRKTSEQKLNKLFSQYANHDALKGKIVDYIFDFGKNSKIIKHTISFDDLSKELSKQRKAFIDKHPDGNFRNNAEENRNDLIEALNSLIKKDIFQQGLIVSCKLCGVKRWYGIDELSKNFNCKGCNHANQVLPETDWIYLLNPLLTHSIGQQGTAAVLWSLYDMLMTKSKFNFLFLPSLNLYRKYDDKENDKEIDFACIMDGEFMIGEVKNKASLFKTRDIEELARIAKRMPVSKVILATLDQGSLTSLKTTLEAKLKNSGIKVAIIQPSSYFFEESYHIGFDSKIFKFSF